MTKSSDKLAAKAPTIDRRLSGRMHLPATATLIDQSTDSKQQARIADLGKGGCYVDLLNPSPVGTPVSLVIRHANKSFEADGIVTYTLPRMGMGITFTEVLPNHEAVLEEWLGMRPAEPPGESAPPESARADTVNRAVLKRLITLLMRQRVITETQGADLVRDLKDQD